MRARKLHLLHGARGDELEDGAAAADQIGGAGQRLDGRDAPSDRQRDLRILRPERVLRPHLGGHGVRGLVPIRLGERIGRGIDAQVRVIVDQAGRHILAGAVHHDRVGGRLDVGAHRDDAAVLEEDRAVGNLLPGGGHDRGVADQHRRIGVALIRRGILRPVD